MELTVEQFATKHGVSTTTVYNWIQSGRLETKKIGKITIIIKDNDKQ